MTGALLEDSDGLDFFEVVQGLESGVLAEQHVSFDEVGKEGVQLVARVFGGRDSEHIVEFLGT